MIVEHSGISSAWHGTLFLGFPYLALILLLKTEAIPYAHHPEAIRRRPPHLAALGQKMLLRKLRLNPDSMIYSLCSRSLLCLSFFISKKKKRKGENNTPMVLLQGLSEQQCFMRARIFVLFSDVIAGRHSVYIH